MCGESLSHTRCWCLVRFQAVNCMNSLRLQLNIRLNSFSEKITNAVKSWFKFHQHCLILQFGLSFVILLSCSETTNQSSKSATYQHQMNNCDWLDTSLVGVNLSEWEGSTQQIGLVHRLNLLFGFFILVSTYFCVCVCGHKIKTRKSISKHF